MEKYKDKSFPVKERIADLISKMTLEEKARQIDQYSPTDLIKFDKETGDVSVDPEKLEIMGDAPYGVIGLGKSNSKVYNELQRHAIENTRLGIPILFCTEALHGYGRHGATVFPQQIALGCTFDPSLGEEMGASLERILA